MAKTEITYIATDLVLVQEADGWSFHAPGSTDEQIADGSAPYIVCGEGKATRADREAAFSAWQAQVVINNQTVDFDAAVNLMDDDLREAIHDQMAGNCTKQEFADAYCMAHTNKFGCEFKIN